MKRLFFSLLVMMFVISSFAQHPTKLELDSLNYRLNNLKWEPFIEFKPAMMIPCYANDSCTKEKTLPEKLQIFILKKSKDRYLCTSYGKVFYIPTFFVIDTPFDIDKRLEDKCELYKETILINSLRFSINQSESINKALKSYNTEGLPLSYSQQIIYFFLEDIEYFPGIDEIMPKM